MYHNHAAEFLGAIFGALLTVLTKEKVDIITNAAIGGTIGYFTVAIWKVIGPLIIKLFKFLWKRFTLK